MAEPTAKDCRDEGFEPITDWVLDGDKIRLESLEWEESSGWLYAFVVDDSVVKYVGLTSRILRSRMDNYRDGKVDQNRRLRDLISLSLRKQQRVSVFGKREGDSVRLDSEEARLRGKWTPEWNRM